MKKLLLIATLLFSFSAFADDSFDAMDCQARFSPNGGVTPFLVQYIDSAKSKIRLLAYNFTSVDIANALIKAKQRGVDVQLVLDKSVPTEKNSALPTVFAAGIPSYIDRKHMIAHNKVILVDDTYFETGSFNYTDNAEKHNGENAIMCKSVKGTALYNANWELHKSHSELYH